MKIPQYSTEYSGLLDETSRDLVDNDTPVYGYTGGDGTEGGKEVVAKADESGASATATATATAPPVPPLALSEMDKKLMPEIESWSVPSSSGGDPYTVTRAPDGTRTCTCLGFKYRRTCRHIKIVNPRQISGPSGVSSDGVKSIL